MNNRKGITSVIIKRELSQRVYRVYSRVRDEGFKTLTHVSRISGFISRLRCVCIHARVMHTYQRAQHE